jgi:uncharacterized membrane protein YdjX (TVP38/TMEM64 family)
MCGQQEAETLKREPGDPSAWKFILFIGGLTTVLLTLRYSPLNVWLEREQLRQVFAAIAAEPWSPVVFVLSFCTALCVGLPATPFTLVGGVVFGLWPGALYNWLGTTLGAAMAFLIARYLGRPFIHRLTGERLQRLDEAVARNGFWAIFTMRMIPIVPFNLSNFAAGLTRVTFAEYTLATGLAIMPGLTIFTYFAHALWMGDSAEAYYHLTLSALLMILMSTLPWLHQRRASRNAPSHLP